MSKDDPSDDDCEKAWREIVHDRIEEVFARQPKKALRSPRLECF